MNQKEWRSATDPTRMLLFLREKHKVTRVARGRRTLRLSVCACCRRTWSSLSDERSRQAIEVAERFADGQASAAELAAAKTAAFAVARFFLQRPSPVSGVDREWHAAEGAYRCAHKDIWSAVWGAPHEASLGAGDAVDNEDRVQCAVLRDLFGDPYHPLKMESHWRTKTVISLAQSVYEERELPSGELKRERLLDLADHLEEAGATREILQHLCDSGPHWRGCHVIDLLLGN